jgi:DUF971 family protein
MFHSSDPKSVHVELTAGTGLDIEWQDGHCSHYSFPFLRDACPCAECGRQRCDENRKPGESRPLRLEDLFPPFRPSPNATKAEPVSRYGIRLSWDDGHDQGTFSWEFLREICPCVDCSHIYSRPGVGVGD